MTLNMIKLCVGADSIEDLATWQTGRLRAQEAAGTAPQLFHTTRMVPKRQDELLAGGSLYWVIKGVVQLRQRITGFDSGNKEDGTPCCLILLDRKHHLVRPTPRRPFQGWRYLTADDAPPDLAGGGGGFAQLPAAMRRDLTELGLI